MTKKIRCQRARVEKGAIEAISYEIPPKAGRYTLEKMAEVVNLTDEKLVVIILRGK